ncbi:hypothetical protein J6T66_01425 [bacterium]|nr:hypothetical protein [bacterium]
MGTNTSSCIEKVQLFLTQFLTLNHISMTTNDKNEKKVTLRMVIKYFIKKSKPYKWLLLLSFLGSIIIALVSLLSPIYGTKLVDIVAMT